MPLYGPKFTETEFKRGKNILASEHLQFIEAGATLDAEEFDKGFNGVGKAIAQNVDTGKFEPVADKSDLSGYTNFGILNVDFINDGETDVIAGEVIVRGSVYEQKLADEISDKFKEKTPMIRYVNQTDFVAGGGGNDDDTGGGNGGDTGGDDDTGGGNDGDTGGDDDTGGGNDGDTGGDDDTGGGNDGDTGGDDDTGGGNDGDTGGDDDTGGGNDGSQE